MMVTAANRNTDPVLTAETTERAAVMKVVAAADSGNNTILAAPGAGKFLQISAVKVERGTANTAATQAYWQWGTSADVAAHFWGTVTNDAAPGETLILPAGSRWIGPANTALVLDLGAANAHVVSVRYSVEDA